MIERESGQALPEGLAEMSPGPELAAALSSVDRSRLCGFDLVVVLQARGRQLAFDQAELAADLMAVAECVAVESSGVSWVWNSDIDGLAAAEIAAALTWTKRTARSRLQEARLLIERLPQVWAALRAGSIDAPKTRVIVEGTNAVDDHIAHLVIGQILPEAPGLTTGQLAYRLRRLIAEADPEAAQRRHEEAVKERKVVRGTNPDGSAFLSGCNLPVDQAAAADERLDALARAAKRSGDSRPMDHIRADIYLGLIAGTWQGPSPVHRRGVIELTADLPTLMGLAERAGDLSGWGPVIADIARQIAAARAADPDTDTIWRYSITHPLTGALLYHGTTRPPTLHSDGTTPGETIGRGPTAAATEGRGGARTTKTKTHKKERSSTRPSEARPGSTGPPGSPPNGAGPGRTTTGPAGAKGADWDHHADSGHHEADEAARDQAEQDAGGPTSGSESARENAGGRDRAGRNGTGRAAVRRAAGRRARNGRDRRRFPTSRQRAFVIARDRTCRGPGCRVPASRSEIDHRIPHAHGGPTEVGNLDAECTHCHDLKDAGWKVHRNRYDDTVWTSILGHTYRVPAEPVTPPWAISVLERCLLDHMRGLE
ncbi:DUF222 domain-containing protein [Actinomadura alba]|uniref:DUF222 domain-containing protein n=1 Tax=Actinomadura alba TaxID=406431 RepID=UPI001C9D5D7F|nr:DUF222 domain-containing protein [Actinomadura alba]